MGDLPIQKLESVHEEPSQEPSEPSDASSFVEENPLTVATASSDSFPPRDPVIEDVPDSCDTCLEQDTSREQSESPSLNPIEDEELNMIHTVTKMEDLFEEAI